VLYEGNVEYSMHLFFYFHSAEDCWRAVNLWDTIQSVIRCLEDDEQKIVFYVLCIVEDNIVAGFVVEMWSMEKRRNCKVWDDIHESADLVVSYGQHLLQARRAQSTGYSAETDADYSRWGVR